MYFGVVISLADLDCSKTDGFRFTNDVTFPSPVRGSQFENN